MTTTEIQSPKILLTGATGFIGGTILNRLVSSSSPTLRDATITCLLRGADRAARLSAAYGSRVRPVLYEGLDDVEATVAAAAEHDVVIGTTLGFHMASAQALLRGLAQRKAATGRDVWMFHLSGASNVSDRALSGAWVHDPPDRSLDDAVDDVYGLEKDVEARFPYLQRVTELSVVDTGLALGVRTLVLMPPMIYGVGRGLFNRISIQIPAIINTALEHGRVVVIGEGKGRLNSVHVEDLAQLYEIVLLEAIERDGAGLPQGKRGIIFAGSGMLTWLSLARHIAEDLRAEGVALEQDGVGHVSLPEATKLLAGYGDRTDQASEPVIEVGMAGNCPTVASVAKKLGWKPTRGEDEWRKGIRDDVKAVLAKREASS